MDLLWKKENKKIGIILNVVTEMTVFDFLVFLKIIVVSFISFVCNQVYECFFLNFFVKPESLSYSKLISEN